LVLVSSILPNFADVLIEITIFSFLKSRKMNTLFLIFGLGGQEMFFVFIMVLLLFGGNKIPELMKGLGKGIREFNSARANVEDEIRKGMTEEPKKVD
jgi:sec-independent protein translocase protein TatA